MIAMRCDVPEDVVKTLMERAKQDPRKGVPTDARAAQILVKMARVGLEAEVREQEHEYEHAGSGSDLGH